VLAFFVYRSLLTKWVSFFSHHVFILCTSSLSTSTILLSLLLPPSHKHMSMQRRFTPIIRPRVLSRHRRNIPRFQTRQQLRDQPSLLTTHSHPYPTPQIHVHAEKDHTSHPAPDTAQAPPSHSKPPNAPTAAPPPPSDSLLDYSVPPDPPLY